MLFLVACVYDEGVHTNSFRVVEAPSRLAVAQHIVDSPDIWNKFLHNAHLYDPIVRGNRPYYADPIPVKAEEALELIDRSSVDGDSRAQLSIHPITDIFRIVGGGLALPTKADFATPSPYEAIALAPGSGVR